MRRLLAVTLIMPAVVFAAVTPESATREPLSASDWNYIAQKVASGQKDWLSVVPSLAPKADQEQADQLEDALATALPTNTKNVLSVLHEIDHTKNSKVGGTDIVCVMKVVKSGKEADVYYADTRLALLDDPNGAKCLWNLEGVWEEAKQYQNKSK
ncbi:hypothetical protein AAH450_19845 [Erwinia sp. P7711]|uniref:hypothetical protein n=1 Tax=Erwinia sp. P7711 TaxID=3141451 RepID=UPI0031852BBB